MNTSESINNIHTYTSTLIASSCMHTSHCTTVVVAPPLHHFRVGTASCCAFSPLNPAPSLFLLRAARPHRPKPPLPEATLTKAGPPNGQGPGHQGEHRRPAAGTWRPRVTSRGKAHASGQLHRAVPNLHLLVNKMKIGGEAVLEAMKKVGGVRLAIMAGLVGDFCVHVHKLC